MELNIRGLKKRYGDVTVFDHFDCSLFGCAVNVVFGPSGAGKTTLLRLVMGLARPDAGDLSSLSDLKVGAVFQEDRLCDNLSPVSNVKLVAPSVSREAIQRALSSVGLGSCLDKPARELSGGMRRRVALIRALLSDYDLLLLDEPFKGLDETTKETVITYTRGMTAGRTVLLVTHDRQEALAMDARRIITVKTEGPETG